MINFVIPISYGKQFVLDLVKIINSGEYSFNKDYKIVGFFGSFNNCIWNGGRLNSDSIISLEECEKEIKTLNKLGFQIFYTFSNRLILKKHLKNKLGNYLLQIANDERNGVIIGSKVFYSFLKKEYPKFKTVYSITNNNLNIDSYNKLSNKYDELVLDFRLIKNKKNLNKLKQKNKIVIILNDVCNINCKIIEKHTIFISYSNINNLKFSSRCVFRKTNIHSYKDEIKFFVDNLNGINSEQINFIRKEEVYDFYIKNGFTNFKISSRGSENEVLLFFMFYYFIKNEKYLEVITKLKEKYTTLDFDFIFEALNEIK